MLHAIDDTSSSAGVSTAAKLRSLTDQVHELKSVLIDRDLEILNAKDAHACDIARFREVLRQKTAEIHKHVGCVLYLWCPR